MFLLKISWVIPLLVLVLILLLWWLWKWYQAQQFLARLPTTTSPDIRELFIKGIDDKIFQSVSLARTAQRLRQHISSKSPNSLDIEATIEKTIQAGGWFTPVSATIKNRPEYLVLIDRTTFNDHYSELINHSIIKQLDDQDVIIKSYYFDEVPLRFYSEQSQDPPLTLTELAQTYPEHRLMIFSDGNGLINPITLKTVNWIEQFSVWSKRTLFTLETPDQWGYREHILEEANFLILPANENGLKRLIERLHSGTWKPDPKPHYSFYNQFPEYIQERPRRWLEQHKPDTPVLTELLTQIKDFLGKDAYQWFSACAVYPELRWQLTLYLGHQLELFNDKSLDKLVRLPWFRYGYMPDWLREQLIKDLSSHQERKIRASLYNLFQNFTPDKQLSDFSFEIAEPQKTTLYNLSKSIWSKWVKKAPKNSTLNEHIFLSFMKGKLAVNVPPINESFDHKSEKIRKFRILENVLTKFTDNIAKISTNFFAKFKKILQATFNKILKISDLLVIFSKKSFRFISDLLVKFPKISFRYLKKFFHKEDDELPSLLPLLWLIVMQPITLRDRLKKCGISPYESIIKLWSYNKNSIERQYVKKFLLLLFVVMPIISLSINIFFGNMLGFSIEILNWLVLLVGGMAAGLVRGMLGSVRIALLIGMAIGVVVNVTLVSISVNVAVSVAVSAALLIIPIIFLFNLIARIISILALIWLLSMIFGLSTSVAVCIAMGMVGSFLFPWIVKQILESMDDDYIILATAIIISIVFGVIISMKYDVLSGVIVFIVCFVYLYIILFLIISETSLLLLINVSILLAVITGAVTGYVAFGGDVTFVQILALTILEMIPVFSITVILKIFEFEVSSFILGLVVLTGGVAGYVIGDFAIISVAVLITILMIALLIAKNSELPRNFDLPILVLRMVGGIAGCVAGGLIGIMAGSMVEGIAVGVGFNLTMFFLLKDYYYFEIMNLIGSVIGFFIAILLSIGILYLYEQNILTILINSIGIDGIFKN
jgi:hypothetical protein